LLLNIRKLHQITIFVRMGTLKGK